MTPDFTRRGFPWPKDAVAFHGTAFMPEILRSGFKVRAGGAPEMAGGRWLHSTSLTLVEKRAAAIALGLEVFRRVARREMTLVRLLDRLGKELGSLDGQWGPLVSGSNFQDFTFDHPDHETKALRPVLAKVDQGWTFATGWPKDEGGKSQRPPFRWKRLSRRTALAPPGEAPRAESWWTRKDHLGWTHYDRNDCAFELYKRCISWGHTHDACFDPYFTGTRVALLASRPKGSCGVLACRLDFDRVCPDAAGAVRLGYWPQGKEMSYAEQQAIDGNHNACSKALDDLEEHAVRQRPIDWPRFWDQPWPVRQEGERTRESTMLYSTQEEEIMVFDPSRIRVIAALAIPALRIRHQVGERITFPPFAHEKVDIRVWPEAARVRLSARRATRSRRSA